MLIWLILIITRSAQRNFNLISSNHERQLESFGFSDNGSFNISVHTDKKTTMIIFMALVSEVKAIGIKGITFIDLCSDPQIHLAVLNSSYHQNTTDVSWSGKIALKNIYYPYILNCNYSKSRYSIITDFRNNKTHIDTRDDLYPIFYFILSFIYLFLTLFCLINICQYSILGIFIPPILALTLSSKSIIMASYTKIWFDRIAGVANYDYFGTILFNLCYIFHYTTFFAFPTFVISGWCIYRDTIKVSEVLINIFSSLVFVVGVWSFRFTMNKKEAFISIAIVIIGFVSVFRNIMDYIMITSNLQDIAPRTSQALQLKINLILQFEATFVSILIALGILLAMAVSLGLWDIVIDFIFELLLLSVSLTEMGMFLFRKKFIVAGRNEIGDSFFNFSEEEIENNIKLRMICEPRSTYMALIRPI
ncbi:hypothetical protein M9Y10_031582 [Tritrichomonas musculus]|uniref:Uncharacterized protein n=1 Tax=Tritrichomonas musculus TaxID=1915356 RepID=A0ABR2H312_9EUKA